MNDKDVKVVGAIKLIWSSLDSHLDDAADPRKIPDKIVRQYWGGQKFHKKCVKEYASVIKVLADLL